VEHHNSHALTTERTEFGAGDEVIMSIAGHVSRAMLSRYSHVRMEAKRRALDGIAKRQREADEKRREETERQPQGSNLTQLTPVQSSMFTERNCATGIEGAWTLCWPVLAQLSLVVLVRPVSAMRRKGAMNGCGACPVLGKTGLPPLEALDVSDPDRLSISPTTKFLLTCRLAHYGTLRPYPNVRSGASSKYRILTVLLSQWFCA
jgi:hypothetical protein